MHLKSGQKRKATVVEIEKKETPYLPQCGGCGKESWQ